MCFNLWEEVALVKDLLNILQKKLLKISIKTRKSGGKIVFVGGPAIVHTGASDSVATLIKLDYINAVISRKCFSST